MSNGNPWAVVELSELTWPTLLQIPSARFQLLVAADIADLPVGVISDFVNDALAAGAALVCAWGAGCERFHDIADECIVENEIGVRKFAGASGKDFVITTWHNHDSLREAVAFFTNSKVPTDGSAENSSFKLVLCLGHPEWATIARQVLESTQSAL